MNLQKSAFIFRITSILKWLAHPVVVFVTLQIIWLAITLMWVIWFADSIQEITKIAKLVGSSYFDNHYALMILIIGCVLLGMLLVGTVWLFVISQRQKYLMVQQKSFVSSVTHELRSPLASLQLSIETLKSRNLDVETSSKMLEMAMEDLDRLSRLVSHILVSSRLDRGITGINQEVEEFSLRKLFLETVFKTQWLDANISKRVRIECEEKLKVSGPRAVFSLIMTNLLENAIKYSPKDGEVLILAELKEAKLVLSFKDKGIGLRGREKKRIFRMFHRSPLAEKKAIPGTGLGLFIVKTLAKSLGGQVWAESPGKDLGSTFFVSFPMSLVKTNSPKDKELDYAGM